MAFGRSNSLSINTGATNSIFGQQNNASSQPPPAGGLFGSTATQTSQPQTGGGLFGSSTAQAPQPQPSGGLFGSTAQPAQTQQSGGLFGSKPAGSSLFGGNTQQPQQASGAGLFGNTVSNNPTQGTSLFGAPAANQQSQAGGNSLFGNTTKPAGSSLFGGNQTSAPTGSTTMFGGSTMNQQGQQQSSILGLSAQQPTYQAPASLLGASQYRSSQFAPFAGKLSMGQPTQPTAAATTGAVKVHTNDLRPTTRFTDCIDELKTDFEKIDQMIQTQERFCREIEAFIPKHGEDVRSLAPDVELVKDKADVADEALTIDAQDVATQRTTLEGDAKDFQRCQHVLDQQHLPIQYRYPGTYMSSSTAANGQAHDADLVNSYFVPLTSSLATTLRTYASNLSEIENHMRVIESSAVSQARQLAARGAGMSNTERGGEDSLLQLRDTLQAFEGGIMNIASSVGQCREQLNRLEVGRL